MPERFKLICIPCKALYKCSAFNCLPVIVLCDKHLQNKYNTFYFQAVFNESVLFFFNCYAFALLRSVYNLQVLLQMSDNGYGKAHMYTFRTSVFCTVDLQCSLRLQLIHTVSEKMWCRFFSITLSNVNRLGER